MPVERVVQVIMTEGIIPKAPATTAWLEVRSPGLWRPEPCGWGMEFVA
jgi:hypothetical protein